MELLCSRDESMGLLPVRWRREGSREEAAFGATPRLLGAGDPLDRTWHRLDSTVGACTRCLVGPRPAGLAGSAP